MRARLESGEEARAIRVEKDVLTLWSPRAFAPGSPIRLSVSVEDRRRGLEGRTIHSKRIEGELFEVRLRLVNLRRSDREILVRELQ